MSAHTAPPSRNHPSRSPPLALGALLAWAGTARAQSETELWSSNLTVGVATVRRYEMRGYTTAEPEVDGTLGRLTDNDFGYASGGYRVTSLFGFRDDPPERSRLRLWSQVAVRPAQALAAAPDGAARLDASGLGLAELPPLGPLRGARAARSLGQRARGHRPAGGARHAARAGPVRQPHRGPRPAGGARCAGAAGPRRQPGDGPWRRSPTSPGCGCWCWTATG